MKKKDRKRSQRKKNWEGTTSELSRTYGQIVDRIRSRRTTEGEKRNENRENRSWRRLGPRSGRPRTAIGKTKETTNVTWEQYVKSCCCARKKSCCCARNANDNNQLSNTGGGMCSFRNFALICSLFRGILSLNKYK